MLDRSPDWDVLVDRFERVARLMPMFRQRVVPTLPPAPPRWVYDPDFDLRYHLRRVIAPHPGTLDTVLEMARRAEMSEFDHARPMWTRDPGRGARRRRGGAAWSSCTTRSPTASARMQISTLVFDVQPRAGRPRPAAPRARGARAGPLRRRCATPWTTTSPWSGGWPRSRDRRRREGARRRRARTRAPPLRSVVGDHGLGLPHGAADQRDVVADHAGAAHAPRARRPRGPAGRRSRRPATAPAARSTTPSWPASPAGCGSTTSSTAPRSTSCMVTMPISIRADDDAEGGNRITLMRFAAPGRRADPARADRARSTTGPAPPRPSRPCPTPRPSPAASTCCRGGTSARSCGTSTSWPATCPALPIPV